MSTEMSAESMNSNLGNPDTKPANSGMNSGSLTARPENKSVNTGATALAKKFRFAVVFAFVIIALYFTETPEGIKAEKPDREGLNSAPTSFFVQDPDLFLIRIHKLVLDSVSCRKCRIERSAVFVTAFFHFFDHDFMPQVKSFELSPPAHGFGMMGIALFIIGNN